MTVGQLRAATNGLPDYLEIFAQVLSAPFDDEEVELVDVVEEKGRVFVRVCVVDDVDREIRAQDELDRRGLR